MFVSIARRAVSQQSCRFFSTRNVAGNIFFTKDHEYIKIVSPGVGYVGISNYAQESLGELVYIDTAAVGDARAKGDSFGAVESVKSANDVYAPVSFTVVEVNEQIAENAAIVNEAAETDGWMIKVEFKDDAELNDLFDAEAYSTFVENH